MPCSLQRRAQLAAEAARAGAGRAPAPGAGSVDLLARGEPVGAAGVDPGVDLVEEPGDPDHEELVQVGGVDRAEAQPLQQRHLGSSASSRTRWLNSSQESSRLK